ncbi:MAG: Asp-tRNA(Asn)/Glu-tRNA(Gln) amidotransferase subunit GatA, partial [Candidatus Atribacteria bacterium]|nr:Asp-tRNA(Asn)/Glu-tRNA(Gln) amidotransferase subunit GatA [Candidatus Atribacteria bacterium]
MTLNQLTAHEVTRLIREKKVTAQEVIQDIFDQINKIDNLIKAFLILDREKAFQQAKKIDTKVKNGEELPPLAGVAVAIKDILAMQGVETTCGSKILKGFYSPYNATVINRLKEAGAIIIGKTNMDEFAMGSSTENSAFGPTRNPWDLERVPGGSSGGSAAAVAADETLVALGTDTGGSIRQPASLCGMVGLKPTYGRVSRYGLIAYASSLDQIGPITKDVIDCALAMKVISGIDIHDSTSANIPVPDYLTSCREG